MSTHTSDTGKIHTNTSNSKMIRRNTPTSLDIRDLRDTIDHIDNYNEKIYAAAMWYAESGIKIIPFTKYGYPKVSKDHYLSQHDASCNRNVVEKWFHPHTGLYSGSSIAMAHGGEAGYCAIDLDVKVDADGMEKLAELQQIYGEYEDSEGEGLMTLMASTPSGGRHLVFQYHPEIISNSEVHYKGIDTRGGMKRSPIKNGGITFIEPSRKPDGSEGSYRWDDNISEIREIPMWLVDVLNGRTPESFKGIKLQESYDESAEGDHGDGRNRNIYIDLLRFVGIGYSKDQIEGMKDKILERMNPPDEQMVDTIIKSVLDSEAFEDAKTKKQTKKTIDTLGLILNDKSQIIKCIQNLEDILESAIFEHEYGLIQYDDFTQGYTRNHEPMASVIDWSLGIQSWIAKKFKIDFPKTDVRDRVEYLAYQVRPHINTARDYMLGCASLVEEDPTRTDSFWSSGRKSGGIYFKRLCTEVLQLDNPNLHPEYNDKIRESYEGFLWFWLQGVAARACVPACKMEIMLNIFGGQGIGKSTFFRDLCPDPTWFSDSIGEAIVAGTNGNRDELMKLHAKIIVELPELNPIKRGGKSADDKLKQFISAQVDNFRRPYGHDSVDHKRTCALAGTSNNRDVYRDATGNRRFASIDHGDLSIIVGDLDKGVMAEIRDKLWGEVITSFNKDELDNPNLQVAIPHELRPIQANINESHRFEEVGAPEVIAWMQNKTRITWDEIRQFAVTIYGFGDAKEIFIRNTVKHALANEPHFVFKKKIIKYDKDGKKLKANCWRNMNLLCEQNVGGDNPAPKHWHNDPDPELVDKDLAEQSEEETDEQPDEIKPEF